MVQCEGGADEFEMFSPHLLSTWQCENQCPTMTINKWLMLFSLKKRLLLEGCRRDTVKHDTTAAVKTYSGDAQLLQLTRCESKDHR